MLVEMGDGGGRRAVVVYNYYNKQTFLGLGKGQGVGDFMTPIAFMTTYFF